MQAKIHPEYQKATIACACGARFETRSTRKQIEWFMGSSHNVAGFKKKYGL